MNFFANTTSKLKKIFGKSKEEPKENITHKGVEESQIKKSENKMTIKAETGTNKLDLNFDFDEDDSSNSSPSKNKSPMSDSGFKMEQFEYTEKEEDPYCIIHRIYPKHSMVDIEQLPYVPFIKKKKKEGLLNFLGIKSKSEVEIKEIKYLALFDEDFLYMINMTLKENDQNNFYKKIGNRYNLKQINSVNIKDSNDKKCISLLFILDNDINNFKSKLKEFYFEFSDAIKFFSILKYYLNKLKIPINYQPSEKQINETKNKKDSENKNDKIAIQENNNWNENNN